MEYTLIVNTKNREHRFTLPMDVSIMGLAEYIVEAKAKYHWTSLMVIITEVNHGRPKLELVKKED